MSREYMDKSNCPKGFRKSKGLCIKKLGDWERTYEQEEGAVHRWFEKDDIIASVVEGYFPSERNIRITSGDMKFDSIEIRGDKYTIEGKSDSELLDIIERSIKRQKDFERRGIKPREYPTRKRRRRY